MLTTFTKSFQAPAGRSFRFTTMIRHQGTPIAFAMDSARRIWYNVLDMNAQDVKGDKNLDANYWKSPQLLTFPTELTQVGYLAAGNQQVPDLAANVPEESKTEQQRFNASTARLTAETPFQVLSIGKYVYLFRQAVSKDEIRASKNFKINGVPVVDSTLLIDRFVFTDKMQPKLEVRYARSRRKDKPHGAKDTLSVKDMEDKFFYEPTQELSLIRNLSQGRFCVLLLPTDNSEVKRWQIFAFNNQTSNIDSFNIERSKDGLFNTRGTVFYTSPQEEFQDAVFEDEPGTCPFSGEPLVPIHGASSFAESAISLNGAGQYIDFGNILGEVFTGNAFTLSCWAKFNSHKDNGNDRILIQKSASDSEGTFQLYTNGKLHIPGSGNYSFSQVPSLHTWHHIAMVFDGSELKVYLDGSVVLKESITEFSTSTESLIIGARADGSCSMDGWVDEVRVWSRPRSFLEFKEENGHRLIGNEDQLEAYWRMDDRSGVFVKDQTDHNHRGNLLGGASWVRSDAPVGDHPGVRRTSFQIKGRSVASGMSALLYYQQEEAITGYSQVPKPIKKQARVLLTFATGSASPHCIAALDIGLARDGRLAQIQDLIDLPLIEKPAGLSTTVNVALDRISLLESKPKRTEAEDQELRDLRLLTKGEVELQMKLLNVDSQGLTCSGALLGFAFSQETPFLFDSITGNISMYFRGENKQFFTAYYHTLTARAAYRLPAETGGLILSSRLAGNEGDQISIEIKDGKDADHCTLIGKNNLQAFPIEEIWKELPRDAEAMAAILNGQASTEEGDPFYYDYALPETQDSLYDLEKGSLLFHVLSDKAKGKIGNIEVSHRYDLFTGETEEAASLFPPTSSCSWIADAPGTAMRFNGNDTYLRLYEDNQQADLDTQGDVTLECWVKPAPGSASSPLILAHTALSKYYLGLEQQSGEHYLKACVGSKSLQATVPLVKDRWNQVAMVFNQAFALKFSGNSFINCGNEDILNTTRELCIEVYGKVDDLSSERGLIGKGPFSVNAPVPYGLSIGTDKKLHFYFEDKDNHQHHYQSTKSIEPGTHFRVGAVRRQMLDKPGTWKIELFVNGEDAGSWEYNGASPGENGASVLIGKIEREGGALPCSFKGTIGEVRLWSTARSKSDIGVTLNGREPGLTAWWRMEENEGNITYDQKGSSHGKLSRCTWQKDESPHASSFFLLLNGETVPTQPVAVPDFGGHQFFIGGYQETEKPHFEGDLDEIRIWRTARSKEQIQDNLFRRLQGEKKDLVAYYDFDVETGQKFDTALVFDDPNFCLQVPAFTADFSQGVTLEAWLYFDEDREQDIQKILEFGTNGGKINDFTGVRLFLNSYLDTIQIGAGHGDNPNDYQYIKCEHAITFDKWMHVAAILHPSQPAQLFINGKKKSNLVLVQGGVGPIQGDILPIAPQATRKLNFIGNEPWPNEGYPFKGKMTDLRIWDNVRSASEIQAGMSTSPTGSEANLFAYYPLKGIENGIAENPANPSLPAYVRYDNSKQLNNEAGIAFPDQDRPVSNFTMEAWIKPEVPHEIDAKVPVLGALNPGNAYQSLINREFLGEGGANFEFLIHPPSGDLFAIKKWATGSGKTEIHILSHNGYTQFTLQTHTILNETDPNWTFGIDNMRNVYGINRRGSGGKVEIHRMTAASGYQSFDIQASTPLHNIGDEFELLINAASGDLYAIKKYNTGSGKTEIHKVPKNTNYQSFALQIATGLHTTDSNWNFATDGTGNLWAMNNVQTGSKTTEFFQFSIGSGYKTMVYASGSAFPTTSSKCRFFVHNNGNIYKIVRPSDIAGTTGQHYIFEPPQAESIGYAGQLGAGISVGTNGISLYHHGKDYMPMVMSYEASQAIDTWTHVAVVYQDDTPSLYLNGKFIQQGSKSPKAIIAPHVLGGGQYGTYKGGLSEMRVWKTARTQAQIEAQMFNRFQIEAFRESPEDLFMYAPFPDPVEKKWDTFPFQLSSNQSTSFADSSGNGIHLGMGDRVFRITMPDWVLSTAPISNDTAQVRSALTGVKTRFHAEIDHTPAVREYGDVQFKENGEMFGVMKRCYAMIQDGRWEMITGFKVGNLISEWIGQAQSNPQLMGFIEGAPPIPSENFTYKRNEDDDSVQYEGASSIEIVRADSEINTYSQSREQTFDTSLEMSFGLGGGANVDIGGAIGWGGGMTGGPIALFIAMKNDVDTSFQAGVKGNFEQSMGWSSESSVSLGKTTTLASSIGLSGTWEKDDPETVLSVGRRYIPKNMGMALVRSETVDIFALRLAHNNSLVSFRILPNPDIPKDWNIITFKINPRYTKQGTLDGRVGFKTTFNDQGNLKYEGVQLDQDYANGADYGEYSYFKPREAFHLQHKIRQEEQELRNLYNHYNGAKIADDARKGAGMGANMGSALLPLGSALGSIIGGGVGAGTSDRKLPDPKLFKRNLINTYVWTAEGGFFAETNESMDASQEVVSGSFSVGGMAGGSLSVENSIFGADFSLEMSAMFGGSLNLTSSKSKESETSFSMNLDLSVENDLQLVRDNDDGGHDYFFDEKGEPILFPGKVNAYRFMSFYLQPDQRNFQDFFHKVVDPQWIKESNDPNAIALRQLKAGEGSKKENEQSIPWRVMHRVTFVSRILPPLEDAPPGSFERNLKVANINSNWELIKRVEPFVKNKTASYVEFTDAVRDTINTYMKELAPSMDDIIEYLCLYFMVFDD